MNHYWEKIREELPGIRESDLQLPLEEGCIDSVDLLCIRVILERRVGELPDEVWNGFHTVQQAIVYCLEKEGADGLSRSRDRNLVLKRVYDIGMPHMANGGLSEHWLFKEMGHLHWTLLCEGLGTRSGALKDDGGNRLYPAFVRIQTRHDPLALFAENEELSLEGGVRRFGSSTYISRITGRCGQKRIEAQLMTAFSGRVEGDNSRLFKSVPMVEENTVPEYTTQPLFLGDYRLDRKGLLESHEVGGVSFGRPAEVLYETEYELNPYYEINGVGLLYFAAYPVISDTGEARFFHGLRVEGRMWEERSSVVLRDVFYFANCNRDDRVIYRLHRQERMNDEWIKLYSSLYRKSDGKLMARIYTVKVLL